MSKPEKRWSWRAAFGRSTGAAFTGAAGGLITGSLGGPISAGLGAAVFGAVGFCGGMIGAGLGHWWDELDRAPEQFGSGALFTLVVAGPLVVVSILLLAMLVQGSTDDVSGDLTPYAVVVGFLSVVASAAKSLIDDLHYAYFGGRQQRLRE